MGTEPLDSTVDAEPDRRNTVVGIDPSLTATAVCVYTTTQVTLPWTGVFSSNPSHGFMARMVRFEGLVNRVLDSIIGAEQTLQIAAVFIEGYSFGSRGRALFDLAEYGGILRHAIYLSNYRVVEVPPSALKKFVTNKGNADKTAMVTACVRRWGVEYGTDDEYDAYSLCRFGACYLGLEEPATAFQREAVEALTNWKPSKKKRKAKALADGVVSPL